MEQGKAKTVLQMVDLWVPHHFGQTLTIVSSVNCGGSEKVRRAAIGISELPQVKISCIWFRDPTEGRRV